jgi:hypothetical protein
VLRRLGPALIASAAHRAPDFIIGEPAAPYLRRWWLTPWSGLYRALADENKSRRQRMVSRLPGIYLHQILRSDDDRALHDHPWPNASILLAGSYIEHTIAAGGVHHRTRVRVGDVVLRRAGAAHRLEIDDGPCWSLFLFGPRIRDWGFHCPERGWVHWRDFVAADNPGAVGKGCDP